MLKAHFAEIKAAEAAEIEANGEFTEPNWREVISTDGLRCFVTRFREAASPKPAVVQPVADIPADLSIPSFLRRMAA